MLTHQHNKGNTAHVQCRSSSMCRTAQERARTPNQDGVDGELQSGLLIQWLPEYVCKTLGLVLQFLGCG